MSEITLAEVTSLCAARFRDRTITDIVPLGRGRLWTTFQAQSQYRAQTAEDGPVFIGPPPDGGMTPVPITIRVRAGEVSSYDSTVGGRGFLCGSYEKGYRVQLWRYVDGVTPADQGAPLGSYLSSLITTLRATHRGVWAYGSSTQPFTTEWWSGPAAWHPNNYALACVCRAGLISRSEWRAAHRSLKRTLGQITPVQTALLHGDLSPRNLLLRRDDPTQVAGLIDWDDAHLGDYMWDLAGLLAFHDEDPEVGALTERALKEYHGLGAREGVAPALWLRFWAYSTCHAALRLASHYRRDPSLDLTRGTTRLRHSLEQLTRLV